MGLNLYYVSIQGSAKSSSSRSCQVVVEKPLHVQAKWRNPTVLVAQTVRVPSEQVEETASRASRFGNERSNG